MFFMAKLAVTLPSSTGLVFDKVRFAVLYQAMQFFGSFAILIFENGNITSNAAICVLHDI